MAGIEALVLASRKRIRWASGVYGRHEPDLRERAELILREELAGAARDSEAVVSLREGGAEHLGEGVGYTNGSRMNGAPAGAIGERSRLLGEFATVIDAEMVGIAGAWREGYRGVASDSQAAIKRCLNLTSGAQKAGSWIDDDIVTLASENKGEWERSLILVNGHSGIAGNEEAANGPRMR